jgi:hypothetical protein
MKVQFFAGALLLAATVFSVGCGVEEEATSPMDPMESIDESAATVWCTNKAWRVDFFAEPAQINRVGWIQCQCYQPQTRSGVVSQYQSLAYEFTCDLN